MISGVVKISLFPLHFFFTTVFYLRGRVILGISRNKKGEPNSVEAQYGDNGELEKYTEFDENGNLKKEVRLTGKDHGDVPRPNVKEPIYNTNPKTGETFQNGYRVRPAEPWELNLPK